MNDVNKTLLALENKEKSVGLTIGNNLNRDVENLLSEIALLFRRTKNRSAIGGLTGGAITLGWIIFFSNLQRYDLMFGGGMVLLFGTAGLSTLVIPKIPNYLVDRIQALTDSERLRFFDMASEDPDLLKWITQTFSFNHAHSIAI